MGLVLILVALIAFIVLSTTRLKLHPFLALLAAALIAGFAYQLPGGEIIKTMTAGFGGILGYIGIVIVLGTIIGVILERSGAAITMAEAWRKLSRSSPWQWTSTGAFNGGPCSSCLTTETTSGNSRLSHCRVQSITSSTSSGVSVITTN